MKGIFNWFKDTSKMKRWIMLILVGVVFASYGMASLIVSKDSISFLQALKIIVYFVIGFTCVVMGLVYINKRTMELFVEATDDRRGEFLPIGTNPRSFDGRYTGTVPLKNIKARVIPLITGTWMP